MAFVGYDEFCRSASVDNTLLDLQNSSYPTQSHSIIAKYDRPKIFRELEVNISRTIGILRDDVENDIFTAKY